uniref:Receptor expression-enhancing protein n=1 Tax=Meloidogyne hapla TaxID=6305 RepID=A0A1I8BF92_MELHA
MVISAFFSRIVILLAGTLYPGYRSYKAVRTKDVKEYVKWMMYWIVFALFHASEALADILLAFWTKGSSILYRKWVHPMLMKHEEDIDVFLEQAKNESYRQVVNLGTLGLSCARDIVATAALRSAQLGQVQLADLHRSLSTKDVNIFEMFYFKLKIYFFKSKSSDVCIIEESEKQTNSQISTKEKVFVEQEPGDPRIEWEAEA